MTDCELMQQALDLLDDINQCSLPPTGIPLPAEIDHVMEALRARLAQPQQEPVAWELRKGKTDRVLLEITNNPQRARDWKASLEEVVPLYTAPPQREWQGLTDEEIDGLAEANLDFNWKDGVEDFARAIEAKLREKNT